MKAYVKPELFYEDFQLSTHIARCEYRSTFNSSGCTATIEGETVNLFSAGTQACVSTPETYCYTTGLDNKVIFTS